VGEFSVCCILYLDIWVLVPVRLIGNGIAMSLAEKRHTAFLKSNIAKTVR